MVSILSRIYSCLFCGVCAVEFIVFLFFGPLYGGWIVLLTRGGLGLVNRSKRVSMCSHFLESAVFGPLGRAMVKYAGASLRFP